MSTLDYDVFLSHSAKAKPAVRELAERLKKDGLRVWLDEWEIAPGGMIGKKVSEGLERSHHLVLVLSKNLTDSEWAQFEYQTILFSDPTNAQHRLIPLRLDDSEIRPTLRQFAYVDWRERDEAQYARLLAACRPPGPEEAAGPTAPSGRTGLDRVFSVEHTGAVHAVALSGDRALSGSGDSTLRLWDLSEEGGGRCLQVIEGHTDAVFAVAFSGDRALSGSVDNTVRMWDLSEEGGGRCLRVLEGHADRVRAVSLSRDGLMAISGSDDMTVRIWDLESGQCVQVLVGHAGPVLFVAFTHDGYRALSVSEGLTTRSCYVKSGTCVFTNGRYAPPNRALAVALRVGDLTGLCGMDDKTVRMWHQGAWQWHRVMEGHSDCVRAVAISDDGTRVLSGSDDTTLRLWDALTGRCLRVMEGHTGSVLTVSLNSDGRTALSGSSDHTVRAWDLGSGQCVQVMGGQSAARSEVTTSSYSNAKILLVGDTGVGKTGLAARLVYDRFEPTISTDGVESTQIALGEDSPWATQLALPHDQAETGVEREIWLWDFAGQPDYRLVHQLFMDETALAAFVFNPQSDNPFEGLGQWDRDLERAARRPFKKLLVAGRIDRGGLRGNRAHLDAFMTERRFDGYLETSANTGDGCADLRRAIVDAIDWESITLRTSPRIFKRLKEEIVKLKDAGLTLLRMGELKQQLEMRLPDEPFTVEELRTVVGLLAGPGVVWQLEFGDFVLLQPERVNAYAAAAIRKVRAHPHGLGCILEQDVRDGKLDYQDMVRLSGWDETILLLALNQTFVDRGLCLRENSDQGVLLVFPSYFGRERPEQTEHPAACVTYRFHGMLEEVYATLVVRLHHTPAFDAAGVQLWRFAADFTTLGGHCAGLKLTRLPEGSGEITAYFDPNVPLETRVLFIRYLHEHLHAKATVTERERHYVCPHCGTPYDNRATVRIRLANNKKDVICGVCEKRILLWDAIEERFAAEDLKTHVREMDRLAQAGIDNESRELILLGHAFAIAGEAGQIFRPTANSDWGIDGEIEFKNDKGQASGRRLYLQLKSGDSYLHDRKGDDKQIFRIKEQRWAEYWQSHEYPVMLVIRTSDGQIRWMNATDYLKRHGKDVKQIVFEGEPFTALNLLRLRDPILSNEKAP